MSFFCLAAGSPNIPRSCDQTLVFPHLRILGKLGSDKQDFTGPQAN